ncbi:MAG: histidinol-phosphate phosphatase family protein [Bacteroidetes bacterium]|nr:histidinol-phosphate phosphatase family protein [Bacteroidota bacterium]
MIPQIDKTWTLFLDRDGVINERIIDGYVMDSKDLILTKNVISALQLLKNYFGKMFVVSNQQCIGKGLCNETAINKVHADLNDILLKNKILIQDFLVCPHKASDHCNCRKPKPGLALQAQMKFPSIDFTKSVVVGDMLSDLQFGKTLGMVTVYVGDTDVPNFDLIKENADLMYDNLFEFAKTF